MTPESLRELLARVHQHLSAGGGSLDGESQRTLGTLMRDIERAAPRAQVLVHPGEQLPQALLRHRRPRA